jgi:hypothetical protein
MQRTKISEKIKAKIRLLAKNRCGYCLCQQEYVWDILEVDHIYPLSKGGWLICGSCNSSKYNKTEFFDYVTEKTVPIFNPCTQNWFEHFRWNNDRTKIIGKTAVGRATIIALDLNKERFMRVRKHWASAGWHPPKD